jgi:hypothetical protein
MQQRTVETNAVYSLHPTKYVQLGSICNSATPNTARGYYTFRQAYPRSNARSTPSLLGGGSVQDLPPRSRLFKQLHARGELGDTTITVIVLGPSRGNCVVYKDNAADKKRQHKLKDIGTTGG